MSAQTALDSAISDGYDRLSYRDTLLCILEGAASGGGGSSGGAILDGSGDPNGSVASTASPQFYYDDAGGLYINNGAVGTNSWTQLI